MSLCQKDKIKINMDKIWIKYGSKDIDGTCIYHVYQFLWYCRHLLHVSGLFFFFCICFSSCYWPFLFSIKIHKDSKVSRSYRIFIKKIFEGRTLIKTISWKGIKGGFLIAKDLWVMEIVHDSWERSEKKEGYE